MEAEVEHVNVDVTPVSIPLNLIDHKIIRPGFSIIDIYFDKYRRQNDFKMQYCHSTILHCGPHLALLSVVSWIMHVMC